MRLSLRTKFTLLTAFLALAVVAVSAWFYTVTLTRLVVRETTDRALFVCQQVLLQATQALQDAAERGAGPASESPEDLQRYVRQSLEESAGLTSLIEALVGYSPVIYEVSMTDRQGVALISSDASLPGRRLESRPWLDRLAQGGFVEQLRVLFGPHRVFEVRVPFNLGGQPYGDVRVGLSSALMRKAIEDDLRGMVWLGLAAVLLSTLAAGVASHLALAPLGRISAQLDRISQGETEVEPLAGGDEFGQVSTKITRIGQQLRGVREIFSTLRENLNQIMSGLEDGLLMFSRDGRAVMASPALEKFLGVKPESLVGRRASEIFPAGHPLREALRIEAEQLAPLSGAEVKLNGATTGGGSGASPEQAGAGVPRRVGVSVQVISERGAHIGALLTLRDLESLERIGSQLQVSERLAALGRVTAGVAHEVKNPLNSMRLWLENLKESLPAEEDASRQAVKILDGEIDRLDRVVKTFLDFTRPVELHLEEASLVELLEEIVTLARPQIEQARVSVHVEAPGSLPPARVDRALLKQAILNLVLNACEVMSPERRPAGAENGTLTLTLEQRGTAAELRVADTGPGIPPEYRAKIFQLYFTTRKGGSGIGLATTFRIVQIHNGSIDFDTEVGRGTTFRIELPLAH